MRRVVSTVAAILFSPKSRKVLVLILVGVFVFSVVFSIVQSIVKPALNPFGVGLPSPMVQYISEYGHFSIDRPERWNAFDTPQGNHGDQDVIAFISSGPSSASVFIAAKNFPGGTIEQVAEWGETRASVEPGYALIMLEPYHTSRYEGVVRKYTRSVDIPLLGLKTDYFEDYYVLQDGRGFIISFRTSQELWPDVVDIYGQMMESFEIIGAPTLAQPIPSTRTQMIIPSATITVTPTPALIPSDTPMPTPTEAAPTPTPPALPLPQLYTPLQPQRGYIIYVKGNYNSEGTPISKEVWALDPQGDTPFLVLKLEFRQT